MGKFSFSQSRICPCHNLGTCVQIALVTVLAHVAEIPLSDSSWSEFSSVALCTVRLGHYEALIVESVVKDFMHPTVYVVSISRTLLHWLSADTALPFFLGYRMEHSPKDGQFDDTIFLHATPFLLANHYTSML